MSDISSSDYKRPGTLKFWCQKVLPLVYDDSLSYYELLCKVVDYINNLIHDNSATIDNMDALLNAFNQLQDYVNESFDELNVYNEVSEKIDRMGDDGELLEILEPVTDELTQYVRDQATTQQEYNTQTRNQTSSAIAQQNIYNQNTRDMVSAMVGHPFTASTPPQMSDTTKIYVYTGATGGGYTYGHWYYYNGSAWTDGGEYNSTTIELDRSLNIPDTAADAGSVGVRLRQFAPRESWTSNYRLNPSTGVAESYTGQSTEHAITDFIDCVDMSDILGFDYTSGLGGIITCSVFIYDENSTYLGYIFNSAQYGYVTPGGTMSPLASAPAFQKIRFDVNITTYTAEQFPYNYLDIMTVRRIGTDKSLKAINVPADAEAVGIEITHVKQDINELSDETIQTVTTNDPLTLTVTENYYHWGSAASSPSYGYVHITNLQEGDIITAHASASDSTSRQWRFTDAYNGDTRVPSECIDANRATITIPSGVDNVYLSMESRWITTAVFYLQRSTEVREIVPKGYGYLTDIVDINEYEDITPRREGVTWTTGYIEPSNGNIYTGGSYDSYNASSRISVQEGDVVTLYNANGLVANMRTVAAWYNNAINASAGVSSNTQSYTVPSGVDQIAATGIGDSTGKWFNVISSAEKTGATLKKNSPGYAQARGNLSTGEALSLPINDVKLENVITFSSRITSFSSIKIGKNASGYPYATIDGTNLVLNNGSTSVTVAHGLTIVNDIQVTMFQNVGLSLEKVEICSSGEEFIYSTPFSWEIAAHGAYYVQSVGSVLTDCALSWTNKNIDAPIWLFGDSYISMSDPTRWTYYAVRDGLVKSTMFNGFAGEGSADAFASLLNLLECRIPKVVVWTMGMNNGDSSSAVNATWKSYYDMVIDLSKKYGFELVLYTVPTCPAVNNNFKNAIVRDSGYRYIDADAAVRIAGSTNWISGTLNSDNTHPTEKGAKILYHRVIADLPEMANDN